MYVYSFAHTAMLNDWVNSVLVYEFSQNEWEKTVCFFFFYNTPWPTIKEDRGVSFYCVAGQIPSWARKLYTITSVPVYINWFTSHQFSKTAKSQLICFALNYRIIGSWGWNRFFRVFWLCFMCCSFNHLYLKKASLTIKEYLDHLFKMDVLTSSCGPRSFFPFLFFSVCSWTRVTVHLASTDNEIQSISFHPPLVHMLFSLVLTCHGRTRTVRQTFSPSVRANSLSLFNILSFSGSFLFETILSFISSDWVGLS